MKMTCPICDSSEGIRRYIYGMPDGEPDLSKFLVGGCIFDEKSPTHECINCGWKYRKNKFVYDEEDLDGLQIVEEN